jgi:hypothetical protein
MQKYAQVDVNGSVEIKPKDQADLIRVATGVGDGEVIMPPSKNVQGQRYTIIRISGFGSIFVRASAEGDTFNGAEDFTLVSSGSHRVTFQAVRTGLTTFGYEIIDQ